MKFTYPIFFSLTVFYTTLNVSDASYLEAWKNHHNEDIYHLTADEHYTTGQETKNHLLTDSFSIDGLNSEGERFTIKWDSPNVDSTAMNVSANGDLILRNLIIDGYQNYAVYVDQGTVSNIDNVEFKNAYAAGGKGPAIHALNGGTVGLISKSTFTNNQTVLDGGAIHIEGTLTMTESSFTDNKAGAGGGGHSGGAIYLASVVEKDPDEWWKPAQLVTQATLNLNSVNFTENSSTQSGGAIFLDQYGKGTITNSIFKGNTSTRDTYSFAYGGGALFLGEYSEVTISNSSFIANEGNNLAGGAIHVQNEVTLALTDTCFIGNKASNGAAIYSSSYKSHITISAIEKDVIFAGNTTTLQDGYGIYNSGGNFELLAKSGKSITISDSIFNGASSSNGTFSIGGISHAGTVIINGSFDNGTLNLNHGELILGRSEARIVECGEGMGGIEVAASQALLDGVTLNISENTRVTAIADSLGHNNTVNNSGTLRLQSGTLKQAISGSGDIEGEGMANTRVKLDGGTFALGAKISNIEIDLSVTETIMEGNLATNVKWSGLDTVSVSAKDVTITAEEVLGVHTDLETFVIDANELTHIDFSDNIAFSAGLDDAAIQAIFDDYKASKEYFAIQFEGITIDELEHFSTDKFELSINGQLITDLGFGSSIGADGKTYVTLYAQIPEPSTATLSLLALAGLLVRRRRSL